MRCPNDHAWRMYIDGELQPVDREKLKDHLITCALCSRYLAEARREDTLISSALNATPLPWDLTLVIQKRLMRVEDTGRRCLHLILPTMLILSTLAAVVVNWLPMWERIVEVAGLLFGGSLLLDLAIFTVRVIERLAEAALAGSPLLPVLTVLLFCVAWLRLRIRKGGYAHV